SQSWAPPFCSLLPAVTVHHSRPGGAASYHQRGETRGRREGGDGRVGEGAMRREGDDANSGFRSRAVALSPARPLPLLSFSSSPRPSAPRLLTSDAFHSARLPQTSQVSDDPLPPLKPQAASRLTQDLAAFAEQDWPQR